jgi:hypothetical protein
MFKKFLVAALVATLSIVGSVTVSASGLWRPHEVNVRTAVMPGRQAQSGDDVITASHDVYTAIKVQSLDGNWTDFSGLAMGSTIVFPKEGMPWLVGCGNPVQGITPADMTSDSSEQEEKTTPQTKTSETPSTATATANVNITTTPSVPSYNLGGCDWQGYRRPSLFGQALSTLAVDWSEYGGWQVGLGPISGGYGNGYGYQGGPCGYYPQRSVYWGSSCGYGQQNQQPYYGGDTIINKTFYNGSFNDTNYGRRRRHGGHHRGRGHHRPPGNGGGPTPPNPTRNGSGGGAINPSSTRAAVHGPTGRYSLERSQRSQGGVHLSVVPTAPR